MSKGRSERRREHNRLHLEALAAHEDPRLQKRIGRILASTRIEMARKVVDLANPKGAFRVVDETLSRLRSSLPTVMKFEGPRLETDLKTTAVEMIARAGEDTLYPRNKKRT